MSTKQHIPVEPTVAKSVTLLIVDPKPLFEILGEQVLRGGRRKGVFGEYSVEEIPCPERSSALSPEGLAWDIRLSHGDCTIRLPFDFGMAFICPCGRVIWDCR